MLKVQCGGLGSSCTRFSSTTGYNSRPSILKAYSCVAIQGWYRCPQVGLLLGTLSKGCLLRSINQRCFSTRINITATPAALTSKASSINPATNFIHIYLLPNLSSTKPPTIKMQPQTLASIIAFLCAVSSAAPVTGKPIHNNFISQEPSLTQFSL